MKTRLIAITLTLLTVAVAVSVPPLLRSGGVQRDPQASRRSALSAEVAQLEERVRERPDDVAALSRLGGAYVRRARESGDPAFYALAERAVDEALLRDADNVGAVIAAGELALARHDFAGALALGERARGIDSSVVAAYAIITDALVEMGWYDEAVAVAQEMADRRPGFASYSRISYLRELHGDLAGAIAAMELAAASAGTTQDVVWARVLLGNLQLNAGDIDAAAKQYERAAALLPHDAMSLAGLARLAIARGDLTGAETLLRSAAAQRPLPEHFIALGDVLAALGPRDEAEEQYTLVRAIERLFAANGVDTDIELALFDADHGSAPEATYAAAQAGYERRQSVYAADVVAWAAYRSGRIDEARAYAAEALRLGTRDARLLYHAGVIAGASGDAEAASAYLREAVAMRATLSVADAQAAERALGEVMGLASR